MIRWNNDYNRIAHPSVMDALARSAGESHGGYGLDEWCERARAEIRRAFGVPRADVHFATGGTQANRTVIAAALRPHHAVISAHTGHIAAHETGAIEASGHKVITVDAPSGVLSARDIDAEADKFDTSDIREHIPRPKMVYMSFPSELGTIPTRAELFAARDVCSARGLTLFVDGARLAYGLAAPACDISPEELASAADVFTAGGTKCGALFGEAIVINDDALKEDFRSALKQNGALLAKGWLLGLQFAALFDGGLYLEAARGAVARALRIRREFEAAGIPLATDSPTNQQFVSLSAPQAERLAERHIFEREGTREDGRVIARFCTSWSTTDAEVDALISDIRALV